MLQVRESAMELTSYAVQFRETASVELRTSAFSPHEEDLERVFREEITLLILFSCRRSTLQ